MTKYEFNTRKDAEFMIKFEYCTEIFDISDDTGADTEDLFKVLFETITETDFVVVDFEETNKKLQQLKDTLY